MTNLFERGIYSLQDFIALNERKGFHWFKPDSMRFFKSRVSESSFVNVTSDLAYFISSEQGPSMERRYTIRAANLITGNVDTIGEFQEYDTMSKAKTALKNLVAEKRGR